MKRYLLNAALVLLLASPLWSANHYLDCQVSSSGSGASWAAAWKAFSNITGLSPGDIVYISGSGICSTYSASGWTPTGGSSGNPVIYRVAQTTDTGHTTHVTLSSVNFNASSLSNVWFDGNDGTNTLGGNMTLSGSVGASGTTALNGVHLSYLNMDGDTINGTTVQNLELNNVTAAITCGADHFFTSSASAGDIGYTNNKIHDNVIEACQVNDGSGHGTDGFQWIENVSFYNNTLYSQFTGTANGQHEDFIQTSGDYVAIYNNYFENAGNYPIYGDLFGNVSHWRVYDNICTEYTGHGSAISGQCAGIGFDGVSGFTMTDFTIANNTCYAQDNVQSCVNLNTGTAGNKITNSYLVNNLGYNTGFNVTLGTGGSITQSNNYSGTSNISFVSTAAYPSGNWQLQAGSTNAIGQGVNPAPSYLTSVYTTDYAGSTRANPWDIGAYQFAAPQATAPTCSPSAPYSGPATTVTLTDSNSGTHVTCYTTNGSTPATNGLGTGCTTGTQYSSSFAVNSTLTVMGISGTSTLADSSVTSCAYTINAAGADMSMKGLTINGLTVTQ